MTNSLVLRTAKEISNYLEIHEKQVANVANYLPIFGIGDRRHRYVTTTKFLDFIQDRVFESTDKQFKTFQELIESSQIKNLSKEKLYRKKGKNPITIAFNNLKGGVSKTTTVANLGAILAALNQKVLFVDMDMQNQLSDHFTNESYSGKSLLQIIEKYNKEYAVDEELLRETIVKIDVGNSKTVDLLPSEWDLGRGLENSRSTTNVSTLLRKILSKVKENYDFILIDTPPTNILALELSFFASDNVTFVTNAERKSYESVKYLMTQLNKLQNDAKEFSLDIKVDTVILNKYRETISTRGWYEMTEDLSKNNSLNLYRVPLRELFSQADADNKALIAMSEKRGDALEVIEELIDYSIDLINRK